MLFGTAGLLLVVTGWGNTDEMLPIRVVSMHYPCLALKSRIQGNVRVQCAIGKNGACLGVKPILGHPLLLKDAVENLKKWRYSPSAGPMAARSVVVQYRFVIGATTKALDEPDVVVTFDSPNTVTVVAPFDSQVPCRAKLDERPIPPRPPR
jgi:TonB family protein